MPTRNEADRYALGVRLKQAILLTLPGSQISDERLVNAIAVRLAEAIRDAKAARAIPTARRETLDRLESACRWLLDGLTRGSSDDYLESLYGEFYRRAELIRDALLLDDAAGLTWFSLGLEIVDGSYIGRGPEDTDRLSQEQIEAPWQWGRPEVVRQQAKQATVDLQKLFPENFPYDESWLVDLPEDWTSWARVEAGLTWLIETADDVPKDQAPEPQPEPGGDSHQFFDLSSLPQKQQNIYSVVAGAGSRITTKALLDAYVQRFGDVGDNQIKTYLAEMVRAGILDNRHDVKPGGYGARKIPRSVP